MKKFRELFEKVSDTDIVKNRIKSIEDLFDLAIDVKNEKELKKEMIANQDSFIPKPNFEKVDWKSLFKWSRSATFVYDVG